MNWLRTLGMGQIIDFHSTLSIVLQITDSHINDLSCIMKIGKKNFT